MPFHYSNGANVLTDSENLDPVCMMPGYKQVGVKIEKVSEEKAKELTQLALNDELGYYESEAKDLIWYAEEPDELAYLKEKAAFYKF